MIRQLRRLAQALPAAGPGALALAVYAEPDHTCFVQRAAADQGFEGVACVDDAARAAGLYCAIWQAHGFSWAREAAEGLLRFVCYMQQDDGRFANFVLDWEGQPNLTGPSSQPGGWSWQARAMHALARAVASFGQADFGPAFELGLPWLDQSCPWLDVRALTALTALEYWTTTGAAPLAERALAWADEIASHRLGDLLPDVPGRAEIHLWGHLQELALARIGRTFDRPDLIRVARASADAVFLPRVAKAFAGSTTLPFEVSCAALGLQAVAEATDEPHYAEQANLARAWFAGRNAAGLPIYDRTRGLVHDGLDDGQVNPNSGAESNVEGALALIDTLPWDRY